MKKVLCFGDSNTFGFNPKDGSRFDEFSRWSGILKNFSKGKFEIIEEGQNNRTAFSNNPMGKSYTGYKILPELLKEKFDVVILALGVNDLQSQYGATFLDFELGISNLIEIVKNNLPNAKIILVAPTNITQDILKSPIFSKLFDESSIEKSKKLPEIYLEISKKYNCEFIDLNKVAKPSSFDGLHFEPSEHKKIAEEIFKQLNKI